MQIHVWPSSSESSQPNRLADAEIYFDEGPLAGLRLIGFTIERDERGERIVKLSARVCSMAGKQRELAPIQLLNATGTQKLEEAILETHANALWEKTGRSEREDKAQTAEVRAAVRDLILRLGVAGTVLAVANECLRRAKDA